MLVYQTCLNCKTITLHKSYNGPCSECEYVKPHEDIVKKIIELETQLLGSTDKVNPHLRQILAAKREMLIWVIVKDTSVWKKAIAEMYKAREYAKLKTANDGNPAGQKV